MPLPIAQKERVVAEVSAAARDAISLVVADSRGIDVQAMTGLRRRAREQRVVVRVVKNTLAKRAIAGTDFECVGEALSGPSLLGFGMEEPAAPARLFKDFAKENDAFEVRALSFDGKLLGADKLDALAALPTRDEALSRLMATMLAPIEALARVINQAPTKLTLAFAAVRDHKRAAE